MAKLAGGGKKRRSRRSVRRSRRGSPVAKSSFGRRVRRSSRGRGRKSGGFSLKGSLKEAGMFALAGAGVTYLAMKAGTHTMSDGKMVLEKVAAVTKGNKGYAQALILAALGLGAGYLLRKRSPKIARNLTLAGVGLGALYAITTATSPTPQNTVIQAAGVEGLVSSSPHALPMDAVDGLELDGLSMDDGNAEYGNVAASGF